MAPATITTLFRATVIIHYCLLTIGVSAVLASSDLKIYCSPLDEASATLPGSRVQARKHRGRLVVVFIELKPNLNDIQRRD